MSMAGSKVKPEDLFTSLRTIKDEAKKAYDAKAPKTLAQKFFERFKGSMTEQTTVKLLE